MKKSCFCDDYDHNLKNKSCDQEILSPTITEYVEYAISFINII